MLLEIAVVAGPGAHGGPGALAGLPPMELSVAWPPGSAPTGSTLDAALSQYWAGAAFTVAGELLSTLQPGVPPLVDGAVVVAWPGGAPAAGVAGAAPAQAAVAVLAVCSGPGAGAVFALHRGSYSLGRGRCRLPIADPSLSRHHGTLVVGSHSITLTAVPGSSGFRLLRGPGDSGSGGIGRGGVLSPRRRRRRRAAGPGAAAAGRFPVELEIGQRVACGSSTFELRFQEPSLGGQASVSRASAPDGSLPGTGSLLLDAAALDPLEVPIPGGSGRGRTALMVAGFLPVVLGVVFALTTGSWMFLAFSAMGAATVLVPLLGGSARRKELRLAVAGAARRDAERLASAFPDAASLAAAGGIRTGPASQPPGNGFAVRLGTAPGPAALTLAPADPSFKPPTAESRPACLRLGGALQQVCGPASVAAPLLNYVLIQLDAAGVPVVVLGPTGDLPLEARLLPLTTLATSTGAALAALAAAVPHAGAGFPPSGASQGASTAGVPGTSVVLVVLGGDVDPRLAAVPGVQVLLFSEAPCPGAAAVLQVSGSRASGIVAGVPFTPDGVPAAVFAAHARRRALHGARTTDGPGSPQAAAADSLAPNVLPTPGLDIADVWEQWHRAAGRPLQPVPIGRSADGPVLFDFLHDGPHLLLGGTTGSGKSEFLRTLVGSLAVAHSPAELQFVFIDFKGGAGLGVMRKLPHTSSLITDLGGHGMARTIASLRAELHRRESALAEAEAADSDEYRTRRSGPSGSGAAGMAHLVIVVDEFRVLVDQFPDTLAELMRIAAVGRSLGIHLVMATQRPQGALNADIRANVTSSICLRVQSAFDSVDVIGDGAAAEISVATPGRAYISRAGGTPQEFQSATLRLQGGGGDGMPVVTLAAASLGKSGEPAAGGRQGSDPAGVAALLARAWREHLASATGATAGAAPAVVAPDLPAEVPLLGTDTAGSSPDGAAGRQFLLGTVDVPEDQSLQPLLWQPCVQSHLALFGTVQETSSALGMLVHQLLGAGSPPPDGDPPPAVYLMDGDGSLAAQARNPRVGAHVTPGQLRTAGRLIERLLEHSRSTAAPLVLCVSDWGRWVAALRNSPWHAAEDGLGELVRFSPRNMVVAVGGGRELLAAPFLAAVPNRMYLTHGSHAESTALWPRLPDFTPLPGRAALAGPINDCHGTGHGGGQVLHVAQLGTPRFPEDARGGARGPADDPDAVVAMGSPAAPVLQVRDIPEQLSGAGLLRAAAGRVPETASGTAAVHLLLGLGGDGMDPVAAVVSPGCVLPVIGGPGSGKSTFLQAMEQTHRERAGAGPGTDGPAAAIRWIDDADQLPPQELADATLSLAAGGIIVAAFGYPGPALSRLPMEWGLRTAQQGVVVMPQRPGDAEIFGVRLETMGTEPQGRAVLLERGRSRWFQFAHDGGSAAAGDA
ncbi:S-DNA-T family DNA segregation ATPase FtsK/SpoIIIE [Arthrobacter stackebrandtii]|uniref:S-DNA-T family DNA segregation ATPase FtsK/SpoIIIE n=1 Tax=Arthrobacter stackebrandtii TaxID=272161 RepID=A0ABS4YY33_9MICC|nr:S-DNA-T family DNA segregation ATPase FtsK/SpoIIIE [Arthrobacter stackebrandtii]